MTTSQKRAFNRLLMVLIILLLMVLIGLLASRQEKVSGPAGSTSSQAVSSQEPEKVNLIQSISCHVDETALFFVRGEDGVWYWDTDRDFPLDTTVLDRMIAEISPLEPLSVISQPEALETYGLENSELRFDAVYQDGTELQLLFGQPTPDNTGYYALKDGDTDTVYVLSGTIPKSMSTPICTMMALPQLPRLEPTDFASITVRGAVETVLVAFAHSEAPDSAPAGTSQATATAVWHWHGNDVTDNDRLKALIAALSSMELAACENFKPSMEAVTLWGLDAPAVTVEINYGENDRLTLQIGGKVLGSSDYYVRINDDTTIYSMSAKALEPVFTTAKLGLFGTVDIDRVTSPDN